MAYDEALADRLREQLADAPVTERRMFGGLAFLLAGNLAVAASGQGGLLVRVDPATSDDLLAEPGTDPFVMPGRPAMKGWLRVSGEVLDDDAVLAQWVDRGLEHAATLPPK